MSYSNPKTGFKASLPNGSRLKTGISILWGNKQLNHVSPTFLRGRAATTGELFRAGALEYRGG